MKSIQVHSIGKVVNRGENVCIVLDPAYTAGLKGLADYGHVQVLWWADGCDNDKDRNTLTEEKPYRKGPEELGVFALRSPERPNPIAVSNAEIAGADMEKGIVRLYYIDAFDGTPIPDLKPYTPSLDRVEHTQTPKWCKHWPKSCEESGRFDWEAEFNF